MRDIIASRRIRLYCPEGPWQRSVVRIAMMAEPTTDYPVTLLQGHPDYRIIADENTAAPPLTAHG
jgi:glucosamine-6-phosphate deaminase